MKRIAAGIVASTLVAAAQAEPMYISDKLVVNVYAEANQESSRVATVDSGDAVEAIEKVDSFTHVRLPDDREGWIKSSYLSSQVPAIVRIKELEKERSASTPAPSTQLAEELKRAKEQNATLQQELAAAKTAAAQVSSPAPVPAPSPPQGHLENGPNTVNHATPDWSHAAYWGAGVAILAGAMGFVMGYQALARKIRRKYGSVKIY